MFDKGYAKEIPFKNKHKPFTHSRESKKGMKRIINTLKQPFLAAKIF
jgi:hypothetical protein